MRISCQGKLGTPHGPTFRSLREGDPAEGNPVDTPADFPYIPEAPPGPVPAEQGVPARWSGQVCRDRQQEGQPLPSKVKRMIEPLQKRPVPIPAGKQGAAGGFRPPSPADGRHCPASAEETVDFGFRRVPAGQKPGYVLRHFNAIAGKYDLMNTLLSLGLHHRWKRLAVEALGPSDGERVLDLCGGTADLALLAHGAVGGQGCVILCDINRAMLDQGRIKIGRACAEGILTVQGDAEGLPFGPGVFDAAMVGFGIRNLTHMDRGLAEMHRVLAPGGRLVCLEFSLPLTGWFRLLYDFYSFVLMPMAGRLLAGNRGAYLHLPESIRRFPPPGRVAELLGEAGFSEISFGRLTDGIAVIYRGVKR